MCVYVCVCLSMYVSAYVSVSVFVCVIYTKKKQEFSEQNMKALPPVTEERCSMAAWMTNPSFQVFRLVSGLAIHVQIYMY